MDYLRTLLPYQEISTEKAGAYILAVERDGTYECLLSAGTAYKKLYGEEKQLTLSGEEGNLYRVSTESRTGEEVYANVQTFKLYNTNTPFEQDRWALIGILDQGTLTEFAASTRNTVLITMLISLALSLIHI